MRVYANAFGILKVARTLLFAFMALAFSSSLFAQNDLAILTGTIKDGSGALLPHAWVTVLNSSTNELRRTETSSEGYFAVLGLVPGKYTVRSVARGFSPIEVQGVVLHTSETRQLEISLPVGVARETITVQSAESLTTSSAVSTTIDSDFVQNIPLNGRSFQNLLLMTPGINQDATDGGIVANGMRSDGNYFTVDGISANVGTYRYNGGGSTPVAGQVYQALSGSTPTEGAFGGLQGVISLDAMQEFTVQSSTYSAAYGRQPGAQVQITSKSGGNAFHGSGFDYLRNDAFNAKFSDISTTSVQREREQDFGGTLSGPFRRDKTFFFVNYEGVRGIYPDSSLNQVAVPSLTLRADTNIPSGLISLMKMYPTKNLGAEQTYCTAYDSTYTVCTGDQVPAGYAYWQGVGSSSRTSDNYSGKLDQVVNSHLTASIRYNRNTSSSSNLPLIYTDQSDVKIQTYTLNANYVIDNKRLNTLSAAVSKTGGNRVNVAKVLSGQGGVFPSDRTLAEPLRANSLYNVYLGSYSSELEVGTQVADLNRQLNLVDTFSWTARKHLLVFGGDFRYTYPHVQAMPYQFTAQFAYPWDLDPKLLDQSTYMTWFSQVNSSGVVPTATTAEQTIVGQQDAITLIYKNLSLFAQDTWKVTPRLTIDVGARWEYNPALSSRGGRLYWVTGWQDYATMSIAPVGTPLYKTPWLDVAPRVGFAYNVHTRPGKETILRGGFGMFYDTGQQVGGQSAELYPHSRYNSYTQTTDPTGVIRGYPYTATATASPSGTPSASYGTFIGTMPDFNLPRTFQWNLAVQQALGKTQTITWTYVGSAGRRFLRTYTQDPNNSPSVIGTQNATLPYATVYASRNDGEYGDYSNYHGLQVQYQRQMARGLQALFNYTWSHSLDTNTTDYSPVQSQSQNYVLYMPKNSYGESDNDRRQVFNGIFNYQIPKLASAHLFGSKDIYSGNILKAMVNGWALSGLFRAQSGGSFSAVYQKSMGASLNYASENYRANYNGGQVWVKNSLGFGPKVFNTAAFSVPSCALLSDPLKACNGSSARNSFHSYPAVSQDLTMRRIFPIREYARVEFRAEAFNVFNHPNWGFGSSKTIASVSDTGTITSVYNGSTTATNAAYTAGNGALAVPANNQLGGPRSMRFALKVSF